MDLHYQTHHAFTSKMTLTPCVPTQLHLLELYDSCLRFSDLITCFYKRFNFQGDYTRVQAAVQVQRPDKHDPASIGKTTV